MVVKTPRRDHYRIPEEQTAKMAIKYSSSTHTLWQCLAAVAQWLWMTLTNNENKASKVLVYGELVSHCIWTPVTTVQMSTSELADKWTHGKEPRHPRQKPSSHQLTACPRLDKVSKPMRATSQLTSRSQTQDKAQQKLAELVQTQSTGPITHIIVS